MVEDNEREEIQLITLVSLKKSITLDKICFELFLGTKIKYNLYIPKKKQPSNVSIRSFKKTCQLDPSKKRVN